MIRLVCILLLGASAAFADKQEVTQPLRIDITDDLIGELTWGEDQATITGPAGVQHSFEAYDLGLTLPDHEVRRHDIDGDGVREILVPTGIGYGGVNVFYVILFWRGDSWWSSPEIANPEFSANHKGLTSSGKSGPRYYHDRWDLDQNGNLYLHSSQLVTFAGFDVRRVMFPGGSGSYETLVYETSNLFEDATRVWGVVQDDELSLSATSQSGDVVATLLSGTRVELLEFSELDWKVLVATADGQTGWGDPEALVVDR